ncbi:MAG: RNA-binding S4 domain-containing protein [Selenomonadaceae bacterium]
METKTIEIKTDVIQLDQLLKWAGIIESGGQIKFLLEEKRIKLNGIIETAKRRKIHADDVIEIIDEGIWKVVKQGE